VSTIAQYFLYPVSPILSVVAAACAGLIFECISPDGLKPIKRLAMLAGPLIALGFIACLWKEWPIEFSAAGYQESTAWLRGFSQHFHLDQTTLLFFGAIAVFTLFSLVFLTSYCPDKDVETEISVLTLFIASGLMLLVSADSLLMVFLALELLSLPTYVLVGIRRKDKKSCEASLKYFLFGSFASVFLVLGIALLYAQFGTMELGKLQQAFASETWATASTRVMALTGLVLILISVSFKIGIAPFHMWLPDAYEGAPTVITGFMGSSIKLAGFGLTLRLLWGLFLPLSAHWIVFVNVLAVLTMFAGNLAALAQTNVKRLFAYSSIAHAGYLLLALGAVPKMGASPHSGAIFFYLVIYGITFLGLFACLAALEESKGEVTMTSLSGLGFTNPPLGIAISLFALSAAGIPPTAGFLSKYFIFVEVVRAGQTPFLILGILSTVVGAYYYLRVLVQLYMKDAADRSTVKMPLAVKLLVALCAASTLVFTFAPQLLGLGTFYR
jgi:NADH-quinone oxidoreductase subunit N